MTREAFSAEIARHFEQAQIASWCSPDSTFVLAADFVRRYENRIINVHPSLIPSFCGKGFYGLNTHRAVLASGVKLTARPYFRTPPSRTPARSSRKGSAGAIRRHAGDSPAARDGGGRMGGFCPR